MRHQRVKTKVGLKRDQRRALLRSLVENLILREKIITTQARAKKLSIFAAKAITRGKKADLQAKRMLAKKYSPTAVEKLTTSLAKKYANRQGGYTRIIKFPKARPDAAVKVRIELV